MGMFDYFYSSYDLGSEFTNVECQTKDIDDWMCGTMSFYWLDPAGRLFETTYNKTHEFEKIKEGDPKYSYKSPMFNFQWIPTGKHGIVKPCRLTKYIHVYPAVFKGQWKNWPELKIHFLDGKMMGYTRISRYEHHKNSTH